MNKIINTSKIFIVNNYFTFLVIGIIIFAFILRYFYTKLGLPYLYNWDEPQTASTALKIMKTGDFNPHFFNYGSMMIYSNFVVDILHYLSLMGHPSTAESYLTNMNEIKINADTGWHWTISHPSFYHWNRVLTALLGTGTVFVTYLIGKQVFNKWIGLVAAIFLAILPFHISQSAWISTDVPVAFFVLTVVLFSILFIEYKKLSYFILSLVFVGISIATKYNAALTMLLPLVALIIVYFQSRESVKTYMWFLIPLIPVAVFFMIMPYAIIDLTTFLKHVGHEVRHYKILGHGSATSKPGWEHFSFQLHQFYNHLGLVNTIVIAIGVIGVFFRPLFIFVLILPAVYVVYMTGMTVNFHRNFVQVYPFFALLFATGIYTVYRTLGFTQKRIMPKIKWIPITLTFLITLSFILPQTFKSISISKITYNSRDTRTNVIEEINKIKNIDKIVIAKELRIHSQDLKHLKIPYAVVPLLKMFSSIYSNNTIYLLPKKVTRGDKKKLVKMQNSIDTIPNSSIINTIGHLNHDFKRPSDIFSSKCNGKTYVKIHSINPSMILVNSLPIPQKLLSNPYLQKQVKIPLQSNMGNIQYSIDLFDENKKFIIIRGWAFKKGSTMDKTEKYIVLKDKNQSIIYSTLSQNRPDVTKYFKASNLDKSGFHCTIKKEKLPSSSFEVWLLLVDKNGKQVSISVNKKIDLK